MSNNPSPSPTHPTHKRFFNKKNYHKITIRKIKINNQQSTNTALLSATRGHFRLFSLLIKCHQSALLYFFQLNFTLLIKCHQSAIESHNFAIDQKSRRNQHRWFKQPLFKTRQSRHSSSSSTSASGHVTPRYVSFF